MKILSRTYYGDLHRHQRYRAKKNLSGNISTECGVFYSFKNVLGRHLNNNPEWPIVYTGTSKGSLSFTTPSSISWVLPEDPSKFSLSELEQLLNRNIELFIIGIEHFLEKEKGIEISRSLEKIRNRLDVNKSPLTHSTIQSSYYTEDFNKNLISYKQVFVALCRSITGILKRF